VGKSRFTEEQIVGFLQEHEAGTPTQELCRRIGVGPQTLYRWKAKYGGLGALTRSDFGRWRTRTSGLSGWSPSRRSTTPPCEPKGCL